MSARERFSVSMCVYGGDDPQHFQAAVNSILCQSVMPDEVVLVVDGPVPEALDRVINELERNPLLHVIRLAENRGHGYARRTGMENCSYDLIALMDADDLSVSDRFEKELALFALQPELSAVSGQISEFLSDPSASVGKRTIPCTDPELKQYMKRRCPLNQVTVMLRKRDAQAAGGYLDWYCNEDYYLWIRMALAGMKFAAVPDVLVHVRVGADMYRRRGGWKYFRSEQKLQKLMYRNGLISLPLYCANVTKRLIVQVLLPKRLRGWVFKSFARE